MTEEQYKAHRATIRDGKIVEVEGRTAVTLDELDLILTWAGEQVPAAPEGEDQIPADLNGDGVVDDLEKMSLATLQTTGAALGVTIKAGTTKANAVAAVRAAQAGKAANNLTENGPGSDNGATGGAGQNSTKPAPRDEGGHE